MIGLQALYSVSAIINKQLVVLAHPLVVVVARMFIVGVLLYAYEWYKEKRPPLLQKRHIFYFLYIACCGMLLRKFFYYWALSYTPVTKVSLILNCTPFCIGLIAHCWQKKTLTRLQWVSLLIAFLGTAPILFVDACAETVIKGLFITWTDLALIAGIVLYSVSVLLMQHLIVEHKYPSSVVYALSALGCGFFGISMLSVTRYVSQLEYTSFMLGLFCCLVLINFLCGNAYYRLLQTHSATLLALTDCLGPIFVAVYSAFLFGDHFSWHYYASASLVSITLYFFYRDELLQKNMRIQ